MSPSVQKSPIGHFLMQLISAGGLYTNLLRKKSRDFPVLRLIVEVAEQLSEPNSNSGVSDQQSVGSNPQPLHLCP